MAEPPLYSELLSLLRRGGVEIRQEVFAQPSKNAGGLCRLFGRVLVVLDASASPAEQERALLEAVEAIGLRELGVTAPDVSSELVRRLNRRGNLPRPHRVHAASVVTLAARRTR